ncbi:MAG: hypothetical protein JWR52_1621 [Marmoricola sp.]|nr:hypothetical protein [Marmoricola sp.]
MSKMDDMRAMREARYQAARSGATKPVAAPKKQPQVLDRTERVEVVPESTQDGLLCGHRAISGRTCTREKGHAAKSHRYS